MKIEELKKLDVAQLQLELSKLLREQFTLRMQAASGRLKQFHMVKLVRRQVARIKTILHEKQQQQGEDNG